MDDSKIEAAFSQRYAEARGKFLAAAEAADLDVQSHIHPLLGQDGEQLAMDVVRDGPADAGKLLIISSACHGVEGFCGSGVQVTLLQDAEWRAAAHAAGVAVLYIHALNPYGFSWWRRVTQENVDLNRNFHDFHQELPHNAGYAELAGALVPSQWPPTAENEAVLAAYAAQHGAFALQGAISGGQYEFPEGLFYGGRNPTWSHVTLRHVLQEHGRQANKVAWIDLHTGLGPSGHGEKIFAGRNDPVAVTRSRGWWGAEVTSTYDGSSSSAPLSGLMWNVIYDECAQAEFTGIALEYGTLPIPQMIDALRCDQWVENHPELEEATRTRLKRQVRDAFYTDTPRWKRQIVEQAVAAAHQAVAGLKG
ncbi:MAG: M14 family metallopeptidase [Burkholderiaceae bacterium]|nr:M14 family metallopeptidase [Burkholderiaceae bacterium]